jgi:hypothetical protein
MAATQQQTIDTPIQIPKIDVRQMQITLVGDSPLICHRWSEKAKKEILDKQMKKAKTGKTAKDPHRDFLDSLYWLSPRPETVTDKELKEATFGFPAVAFKAAAVTACGEVDGMKMTQARRRFHIDGEHVVIEGTPTMRDDMVRVGMGTADIRFRAEFKTWRATLTISFNAATISPEQLTNLLNLAGFGIGIGEWRSEKTGSFGRFHVATTADMTTPS